MINEVSFCIVLLFVLQIHSVYFLSITSLKISQRKELEFVSGGCQQKSNILNVFKIVLWGPVNIVQIIISKINLPPQYLAASCRVEIEDLSVKPCKLLQDELHQVICSSCIHTAGPVCVHVRSLSGSFNFLYTKCITKGNWTLTYVVTSNLPYFLFSAY